MNWERKAPADVIQLRFERVALALGRVVLFGDALKLRNKLGRLPLAFLNIATEHLFATDQTLHTTIETHAILTK